MVIPLLVTILSRPYKAEPSSLTIDFLSQAETRAEFSERSIIKLEKTIDELEGKSFHSS